MDGTTPPEQRSRGFLGKIANVIQWIVFAFLAVFALAVASELRKAWVPGAPVVLLYVTVAAVALLALAHLPLIFGRLPRNGMWAAYGAIVAVMILFGVYLDQMKPVWERTPQGIMEAADRAKADRQAAAEAASQKAREDARQAQVAAVAAMERQADIEAKGQALCESLQPNIIEMSKSNLVEVVEINDIRLESSADPTKELSCSGTAVVSRGDDRSIEFGVRTTPQGKQLVTMQLR